MMDTERRGTRRSPVDARRAVPDGAALAAYLIAVAASIAPLLVVAHDHWDGVLIDYAFTIDDFSGVSTMFAEASGPISGAVYRILSAVPGGPAVNSAFAAVSMAVFYSGVYATYRRLTEGEAARRIDLVACALFPFSFLLVSSMFDVLYLYLGLGMWGAVLLSFERAAGKLAGIALVVASSQNLYAFPFVLCLAMTMQLRSVLRGWNTPGGSSARGAALATAGVALVPPLAFYLLYFVLSPSTGTYGSYSQVQSLERGLTLYGHHLTVYALPVALVASVGLGVVALASSPGTGLRTAGRTNALRLLTVAGLVAATAAGSSLLAATNRDLPDLHWIAGRGANLEDMRYSMPSVLGATLALVAAAAVMRVNRLGRVFAGAVVAALVAVHLTVLAVGWRAYLDLDRQKTGLIAEWRAISDAGRWKGGRACTLPPSDPSARMSYTPRFYDLHAFAYAARGEQTNIICPVGCDAAAARAITAIVCRSRAASIKYIVEPGVCTAGLETEIPDGAMPYCYE